MGAILVDGRVGRGRGQGVPWKACLLARQLDELLVSDYSTAQLQISVELARIVCAKHGLCLHLLVILRVLRAMNSVCDSGKYATPAQS